MLINAGLRDQIYHCSPLWERTIEAVLWENINKYESEEVRKSSVI